MDPIEFPKILSHVLLIDVDTARDRFVYRLAGTASFAIHGLELTTRDVTTLQPKAFSDLLLFDLRKMVADKQPQHVRLEFENQNGNFRIYNVLRMPILGVDDELDRVFIVADHGIGRPAAS